MDPRITFDFHGRCIIRGINKTSLTLSEFKLLCALLSGNDIPKPILHKALGNQSKSSVNVAVYTLRRKLGGTGMIKTLHGYGYRLNVKNMNVLD